MFILFQEHFGNNVYNILYYISILDHTFQWEAEALNLSTAFFLAVSAARVHRGPESLHKTLQDSPKHFTDQRGYFLKL